MRKLLLAVVLLTPTGATGQDFTIEQVMSAPFPSGLVAAPEQNRVAWVQNAVGARNIWVAEGPAYRGRQLTDYPLDDGQEVGDLTFTPDGTHLVYVRGGAPNRQGEIPNPTSDAAGASREIWRVALAGGAPQRLAEGSSPALSPTGNRLAFVRQGEIWTMPADSGEAARMFVMRGGAGSLRWSPDGTKLAFVSSRGDHGFIGVYDVASERVTYLMPSVDHVNSPVWSPDGRAVAFIRTPNVRRALPFEAQREGSPWSIAVADPETGEGRIVWTADAGAGSVFHGVSAENQLLWGADDRIVFPWERTGWVHLYAVRAEGNPDLQHLTPGEFEVEHVSLGPDGSEVFYSSNQDDIDRRHLWRVSVSGGTPRAVTSGDGLEWSPVALEDRSVAFLASGATVPAHARVMIGSDSRRLAPTSMPDDFPSGQLVVPQQVVFSSADGMPIHGQLFLPRKLRPGERRPAAIFFHGGSRRQMLLGFHYLDYYHNAYAMNQYLAGRGYIVLSVNYRSGIGYGLAFREALNYGAQGASEFNDVQGAGTYLRGRADVDPDRIGLWGGSYGGYLTALGLSRASDLFAAGVDFHGVHDWNVVVRNFVPSYNAEARAEWSRLAFESSPMAHLDGWRSPVLVIQGDDDRNVPFSETVDLVESLRERGVEFEQLVFPDEVHGFLLHRNWVAAYRAAADFFDRKLKKR